MYSWRNCFVSLGFASERHGGLRMSPELSSMCVCVAQGPIYEVMMVMSTSMHHDTVAGVMSIEALSFILFRTW
jgi:hypothetical protein